MLKSEIVMAFEVVWHPLASADLEDEIDYVLYEFGWAASKKLYSEVLERENVLFSSYIYSIFALSNITLDNAKNHED